MLINRRMDKLQNVFLGFLRKQSAPKVSVVLLYRRMQSWGSKREEKGQWDRERGWVSMRVPRSGHIYHSILDSSGGRKKGRELSAGSWSNVCPMGRKPPPTWRLPMCKHLGRPLVLHMSATRRSPRWNLVGQSPHRIGHRVRVRMEQVTKGDCLRRQAEKSWGGLWHMWCNTK